ncbi:MAG: glutamate racemase [Calditerricola sp.]|jgi:glutamate racemase|nr:glutamate racemase [Bacillota bacterium]MCG0313271.1 glutamate racemase [Calditerricola sp.]
MDAAIGVLDSGVGGLTVVKEILRQLPRERIVYFGDEARCPYGPRPAEEVRRFTEEIAAFLMQFPLKLLVIACNTATAVALESLQDRLPIPVVGVIQPGARAAIKATKNGRIGVIGTVGTIRSRAYEKAILRINPQVTVVSHACPELVPLVESGVLHGPAARAVVERALEPLQGSGIDTLILGCTHYPLLQHVIQDVVGDGVMLISSAEETAREISAILAHHGLLAEDVLADDGHRFFTSGDVVLFRRIAEQWFGFPVDVRHVSPSMSLVHFPA